MKKDIRTCPECGSDRSSVIDTRSVGNAIKRRRECPDCGQRATTYEINAESLEVVAALAKSQQQIYENLTNLLDTLSDISSRAESFLEIGDFEANQITQIAKRGRPRKIS